MISFSLGHTGYKIWQIFLLQYLTDWNFMRYLKLSLPLTKNTFGHTNISRYLTNFASACVLRQLDFDIFAEGEDAWSVHHSTIIFPRGPDSVPHSHAGANLVQGELKLNIRIVGTISYQYLKLLKILVRCDILWFQCNISRNLQPYDILILV